MQGAKDAHKTSEAAHEGAAKGHVSNAKGHAKDAAKQTLGAADAKTDQARSGKTVFICCNFSHHSAMYKLQLVHCSWQGVGAVERDANKAAASGQKEGAKGSMAAVKVHIHD